MSLQQRVRTCLMKSGRLLQHVIQLVHGLRKEIQLLHDEGNSVIAGVDRHHQLPDKCIECLNTINENDTRRDTGLLGVILHLPDYVVGHVCPSACNSSKLQRTEKRVGYTHQPCSSRPSGLLPKYVCQKYPSPFVLRAVLTDSLEERKHASTLELNRLLAC